MSLKLSHSVDTDDEPCPCVSPTEPWPSLPGDGLGRDLSRVSGRRGRIAITAVKDGAGNSAVLRAAKSLGRRSEPGAANAMSGGNNGGDRARGNERTLRGGNRRYAAQVNRAAAR
jgi:hypothetical protein